MSARAYHDAAMMLANLADWPGISDEERCGYAAQAADAELRALARSGNANVLTRTVLARSAGALLLGAGNPCRAASLARWALSVDDVTDDVRRELRDVLAVAETRMGTR
jgi:hypothetical protein